MRTALVELPRTMCAPAIDRAIADINKAFERLDRIERSAPGGRLPPSGWPAVGWSQTSGSPVS